MKLAEKGIEELQYVDTLLTIPNQNLFRIANEKTTFSDAFKMADDVLYAGVRGVTDLMVQPGMINLDFSDIKTVMSEMGKAMMGTGEAQGEGRAIAAAEAAIANPLIDDVSLKGAKGLIINITGGKDITLYEVDEAANRIKQEIDDNANIIYGTTCDDRLEGLVRVSIVATGIDANTNIVENQTENFIPINLNNDLYKQKSSESNIATPNINLNSESQNDENIELETNDKLSEEILVAEANNKNDELTNFDEEELNQHQSKIVENEKIDIENNYDESFSQHINNNNILDENTNNDVDEVEKEVQPAVRRLSLFDSLTTEKSYTSNDEISDDDKSEPILDDPGEVKSNYETSDETESEEISQKEFDPEEKTVDLDQEFNQENEEELLDIPTFLRRQAT